jgi:hypothetical protein
MVSFLFLPSRAERRKFVIFHEIGTFPLPDASNYGILKASTDADTIYYSVSKGA